MKVFRTTGGILLVIGIAMLASCTLPHEKSRIQPLLEGREWALEPERFYQLEGDVDLELISTLNTPGLHNYIYFRALTALRLYQNERVAGFLENYLRKKKNPSLLKRALDSYAKGFSESNAERVETAALRFLKHANADLRLTAALVLQQLKRPSADKRLADFLKDEPEPWIRQALQKN
ncbi:MAG: HEAT repeat domain-containing protein [SAR324 cluster bacterium]|nr:HEAT repeat domain-containing protein [SAR324 cluster bacterium]